MSESKPSRGFQQDDFETAVDGLLKDSPVVTSRWVADRVGCSRERARQYLVEQFQQGVLERRQVGGGAIIYYPAKLEQMVAQLSDEIVLAQTCINENVSSAQSSQEPKLEERVLFFPSRREIAVDRPDEDTRSTLSQTSHLVDSTGESYLYKVSEQDVWNAPYDEFESFRDDLHSVVGDDWNNGFESRIADDWSRAHQFELFTQTTSDGREYSVLRAEDTDVFENVAKRKLTHNTHYTEFLSDKELRVRSGGEADIKERLYEEGYPVIDNRRIDEGESLSIKLKEDLELRDYQQEWVEHFLERKSGVFVGPSGSGKTVAAIATMAELGGETLILVPSQELTRQWKEEIVAKTNLGPYDIGQYHSNEKKIRPVTVATYDTAAMSRHRKLFNDREWGLVIADECHHSVANTWKRFRGIQSKARLGLSATPIRESGDAKQIYTLIGPPVGSDWGKLFTEGWVAKPEVSILLVPWGSERARERYQRAEGNQKLIEASKNPEKIKAINRLNERHLSEKTLVFVDWIEQGEKISEALDVPFINGETPQHQRKKRYEQFRNGELDVLIVSRIGDEGIDLPDAEVAILASTRGSSRVQTGQRAGRTMRPYGDSQVYILLTKGTGEEDWGRESTQYLAEKGINVRKVELNK
jgi:DNA excision repair protein ERCC-3